MFLTWQQVAYALAREAPGTAWRVAQHEVEHPRDGGLRPTVGMPLGQRASFRARLSDGGVLCVEDHGRFYDARIDRPAPVIQAAARPTPDAANTVLGLTAFGALLGLAFGRSEDGALTGALIGGVAGLASVAASEAERSPATSKVAVELLQALSKLQASQETASTGRPTPGRPSLSAARPPLPKLRAEASCRPPKRAARRRPT